METHDPLTLTDAEDFWQSVLPKLYARTLYQIVHMPWLGEHARAAMIQDGAVIENIVDFLKQQFFSAVERHKVWRDAVERWFGRAHLRTTRKLATREAKNYFRPLSAPREPSSRTSIEIASPWESPETLVEKRQAIERILHRAMTLPVTKRRILKDLIEGLTPQQIAARDQVLAGTVRKRIHDLRSELRTIT